MRSSAFDAIIFDFDGTLIDTETTDFAACKLLYEELGASITVEHWAEKIVGITYGYDELLEELILWHRDGITKEYLWQRLNQLWSITLQNMTLMPGVAELLPQLRATGYPLGIATASDRDWVKRWLTHFNLRPYFQAIATGDDIIHNKPAPDVFLLVAAQLDVQPERCLVFEDSKVGSQSAKSAGMTVVAVPSPVTRSLDFSWADRVIPGLQNVTIEWIEAFGRA